MSEHDRIEQIRKALEPHAHTVVMDYGDAKFLLQNIDQLKAEVQVLASAIGGYQQALANSVPSEKVIEILEALSAWIEWENNQIQKEGPHVGKEINKLIEHAKKALAELQGTGRSGGGVKDESR